VTVERVAARTQVPATLPGRRGLLAVLGSLGLSVVGGVAPAKNRRKKRRHKRTPGHQRCGGLAGVPCSPGFACIDDASDTCDPTAGGVDCSGICVAMCGPTVCPAGQVCCNASCGICTPPGGACILIGCVP